MKRKIGTVCMVFGAALVLAALALFAWNQNENQKAGKTVEEILPQVVVRIEGDAITGEEEPPTLPDPYDPEMTEAEIDGYLYVGYLTIPALDLTLPVMSGWSYDQLKVAPCRYYGSTKTDDLVICAHNYARHFGNLKNLSAGDTVYFTDMDGVVSTYEVAEIDTLAPTAIEEMTDSGFALTLFTCTYGGATRVTVRCDRSAHERIGPQPAENRGGGK